MSAPTQSGNGLSQGHKPVGVDPVVHPTTVPSLMNQSGIDQHLHVVAERALADVESVEQLARAQFLLMGERTDDGQPRLVGERAQRRHVGPVVVPPVRRADSVRKVVDIACNGVDAGVICRVLFACRVIEPPVLAMLAWQRGAAHATPHRHHDVGSRDLVKRFAPQHGDVDSTFGQQP